MKKKRIISLLLALLMGLGMFPSAAFATEAAPCAVCGAADCHIEHVQCASCGEYDCSVDHSAAPAEEPVVCAVCNTENCETEHLYCTVCAGYDCGLDHEDELCSICKAANCEVEHVQCGTCGEYDCTTDHTATTQTPAAPTVDYSGDVGMYATLNPYFAEGYVEVFDGTQIYTLPYSDFAEGLVLTVADWHHDAGTGYLWYQVYLTVGELPAAMADGWWIHQATAADNAEEKTLILTSPLVTADETGDGIVTDDTTTPDDTTSPDDTTVTEPVICPVCSAENCTEHFPCGICGEYNCTTQHVQCTICQNYDCTVQHVYCDICQIYDCGITHVWCESCQQYDCGKTHQPCPVCSTVDCTEHVLCEICGEYNCGITHVQCINCGNYDCTAIHIACPVCGTYDCVTDHATGAAAIYSGVVGKYAKLCDGLEGFDASEGPEYNFEIIPFYSYELQENTIFKIENWAYDATYAGVWYKVSFVSGGVIDDVAEFWPAEAWILHDYYDLTGTDEYPATLTVVDVSFCPTCGQIDCTIQHGCGCCESCTGDENCLCECEGCTCVEEEICGCCEVCTGDESCLCECEGCTCVEEEICGCCEACTGDESCLCECEGCTCVEEEVCGCCESCTGDESCLCECEDCTCVGEELPECNCTVADDVQFHAVDCPLYLHWVQLYVEEKSIEDISAQWKELDRSTRKSILAILADNAPEKLTALEAILPDLTITLEAQLNGTVITAKGEIPENVAVSAGMIAVENYNGNIIRYVPNLGLVRLALDISLLNTDGTKWQPYEGETVTITLAALELGLNEGERLRLIHDHEGSLSELGTYSVIDGLLSFEMDKFSGIYAIPVTTVEQNAVDNVIYFDLNAGNVIINNGTYSGYRFDGAAEAKEVKGSIEAGQSYYVYQSDSINYTQTGLFNTGTAEAPKYEMRLPQYNRVAGWAGFITNRTIIDGTDGVIAGWDNGAAAAGRSGTGNHISIEGQTNCHMVLDNIWSSYQPPESASQSSTIAGFRFIPSAGSALTLNFKGDNRFGKIYYLSEKSSGSQIIFAGDDDATLTVANLRQNSNYNYWKAAIGADDGSSGSSAGIVIRSGCIFAGTTAGDDCTAIGGGGNGYGGITINGGVVTAVAHSSGAAIGGGIGKTSVGGEADIYIHGGTVYAHNFSCSSRSYSNQGVAYIPAAAIGGGSSAQATCRTSTVTITGGNIVARSVGGTAIGGGSSADNHGGSSVINISGGYLDAASVAGYVANDTSLPYVKAGAAIGGGTGGVKGNGGNCTLNISGSPVIKTGSIGGGKTLDTTGNFKIGAANVTISGGTLQGQIIMAKGAATDCTFNMTAGEIDNTAALSGSANADGDIVFGAYTFLEENGGAVYVENGEAVFSGGTIKNVKATNGGAFYVTGGDFEMTGGTVSSFAAAENGGAVCVMSGTAKVGGSIIGSADAVEAIKGGAVYVGGGEFEMTGGKIEQCNAGSMGGAVCAEKVGEASGKAKVSGGEIVNVYSPYGGAIAVNGGEFGMTDGSISGVKASSDGSNADGYGGAVYVNNGTAKVSGGSITGHESNAEAGSGGGVYVQGGSFTMTGGTMTNFNVTGNGGMVCVTGSGAAATIQGGTISGNATAGVNEATNGGAVYISAGGSFTIDGEGHIKNCNATGSGGGVYLDDGTFTVSGGSFESCTATDLGGGVYLGSGTFNMPGGRVIGCSANNGGGVYLAGGTFDMDGGSFESCIAIGNGGAVCIMNGTADISGGTIQGDNSVENNSITAVNLAEATNGGGIYVGGGKLDMSNGTITKCSAQYGGAAFITAGECNMKGGTVSYNYAIDGGGMFVENTPVTYGGLNDINVVWNKATNNGGGMYIMQTSGNTKLTTITGGRIDNNSAAKFGGGIYHTGDKGECTVSGTSSISANTAINGGGLYIIGGSTLNVNGGHISENTAVGTPASGVTTAYDHANNAGVGGGVYVGPGTTVNSSFTMPEGKAAGIYSNTANFAADDIYANIYATVLSLPPVNNMQLGDELEATGWYCDYATGDSQFNNNTLLKSENFQSFQAQYIQRYRAALASDTTPYLVDQSLGNVTGKYICLTIGNNEIKFGTLTITKSGSDTLDPDQYYVFEVRATNLKSAALEPPVFQVTVKGDGSTTIDKVPYGEYTVTELEPWSWRYEADTETTAVSVGEGNQTPSVGFTNTRENEYWLDANSEAKLNVRRTGSGKALSLLARLFN